MSTDSNIRKLVYEKGQTLRCDRGPVSFGLMLSGSLVSWSAPTAKDLLIGRCWEGIYLYPTRRLDDNELAAEPIRLLGGNLGDVYAIPADWNGNGREEILATNRLGFIYRLERIGTTLTSPCLRIEGVLKGSPDNLPFNIAYHNPEHPVLDDIGGYIDLLFFNYVCPVAYPMDGVSGLHLVIGDWAGNLWWLPDMSGGKGQPAYQGVPYEKRDNGQRLAEDVAKQRAHIFDQHGKRFLMPVHRLHDPSGEPFLLGQGIDTGVQYRGGNTRPVVYRNPWTGSADLLVLAGMMRTELHYLARCGTDTDGVPVFRNAGIVDLKMTMEGDDELAMFGMHSKIVVVPAAGGDDLLVSAGSKLARFRFAGRAGAVPAFRFAGFISGDRVPAIAYNFTEIVHEKSTGRHFVIDCPNRFTVREVHVEQGEVLLSGRQDLLRDQNGVFAVESETDPQAGKNWGFHRVSRWDFDKSGKQHLVVGTDKGLLYLLIERQPLAAASRFTMESVGPLRDATGAVIKIHNRVSAAGFDVDGDGLEDLVVGGGTYQLGINTDPHPGGGIYWLRNRGPDANGFPVLDPPVPLATGGVALKIRIQDHVQIQAVDIDGDGKSELVIAVQSENFATHVFRRAAGGGLESVPIEFGSFSIQDRLLDLDGDGIPEFVFAGGESGVGYYRKMAWAKALPL